MIIEEIDVEEGEFQQQQLIPSRGQQESVPSTSHEQISSTNQQESTPSASQQHQETSSGQPLEPEEEEKQNFIADPLNEATVTELELELKKRNVYRIPVLLYTKVPNLKAIAIEYQSLNTTVHGKTLL